MRTGYDAFEFKRITRALIDFMVVELSAFYFDIRKDTLYCDAPSSLKRKASVQVVRHLFDCLVKWLAPMLPFTMEEAWLDRYPDSQSVHLQQFPAIPAGWRDDALAAKWKQIRQVRRVVTGALEIERAKKTIGSSLEAVPTVYVRQGYDGLFAGLDPAEIFITSAAEIKSSDGNGADHPELAGRPAFIEETVGPEIAVVVELAEEVGLRKCARSWRFTSDVGQNPEFPDVSARDAAVLEELRALGRL